MNWQAKLRDRLADQPPFSRQTTELTQWLQSGKRLLYSPGDRLIRPDELNSHIYLVLSGTVRLIGSSEGREGPFTLDKRGAGQLIGWTSLMRGEPTELVQASTDVVVLALPAVAFVQFIHEISEFAEHFHNLNNKHESYTVAVAAAELNPKRSLPGAMTYWNGFDKVRQQVYPLIIHLRVLKSRRPADTVFEHTGRTRSTSRKGTIGIS